MKITSKGETFYLADETTGKSGILKLDLEAEVWRLTTPTATTTYPELDTAIAFAEIILADDDGEKED